MNTEKAESVKGLAKSCNDVLEKLGGKREPEVGEWYYTPSTNIVACICDEHIVDYMKQFPMETVLIPSWEEIQRVLERMGYYITFERPDRNLLHRSSIPWFAEIRIPTRHGCYDIIRGEGKYRQEAVMKSVIALDKKLGQELNAKSK